MCRKEHHATGCSEYKTVSRRSFLGWTAGALALAASPGWVPRVVFADSHDSSRDVLVSIFLRGGADSLSIVPPHGESAYYQLRPNLALPRPDSGQAGAALDLDGFFGFAPALAPLMAAYSAEDLLVVHGTGKTDPTRSHFEAMYSMEVGQPEPPTSLATGWLGRHLQTTAPTSEAAVLRAVGIGAGLQRTLVGGPQTLPIADLDAFGFAGPQAAVPGRRQALEDLYALASDPMKTAAENTFRTIDVLDAIDFEGYVPADGAAYPESEFGRSLRSSAALIRAEVGVEAIAVDLGGWDTHDVQGPVDGGMSQLMGDLAQTLAAFHQDLDGAGVGNVTVVVMSEFGRNAFENASLGTDHGHGGMMMVMGKAVAGGRVLTDWPGLEHGQLYEGQDLAITIDYRDVLTEIVTGRLGNPDYRNVFPDEGYSPVNRGVLATSLGASQALAVG